MFTLHPTTSEHQTTKHRSMEKTTQKIRGLFRRTTNEECGAGVRGAAHKRESHTSPSHTAQDKASSLGKGARKGKDRRNEKGMWRPKVNQYFLSRLTSMHLNRTINVTMCVCVCV